MSLAHDITATETLAERTQRLRALRLAGHPTEAPWISAAAEPELEPMASPDALRAALTPTPEQREAFIISCWGEGDLSTYDIAKEMEFVFDIKVTEAEVCRALRRYGEEREPSA